jgi:hypothetical protein
MVKIKKRQRFWQKKWVENGSTGKIESKKRIKCFEWLGYGHLRNKCHNFKRNKGKALNVN